MHMQPIPKNNQMQDIYSLQRYSINSLCGCRNTFSFQSVSFRFSQIRFDKSKGTYSSNVNVYEIHWGFHVQSCTYPFLFSLRWPYTLVVHVHAYDYEYLFPCPSLPFGIFKLSGEYTGSTLFQSTEAQKV